MSALKIPMSPGQLPQQRLYEVVDLPIRPTDFEAHCPLYEGSIPAPQPTWMIPQLDPFARRFPGRALYLAQTEWAWSPMSNRVHAYYIASNRARSHWFLWVRDLDDSGLQWKWISYIYAYCSRKGIPREVAAPWLLEYAWRCEAAEAMLDAPHWINQCDGISIAQIHAICRQVWPGWGTQEVGSA